jgi:hypothetical protein
MTGRGWVAPYPVFQQGSLTVRVAVFNPTNCSQLSPGHACDADLRFERRSKRIACRKRNGLAE